MLSRASRGLDLAAASLAQGMASNPLNASTRRTASSSNSESRVGSSRGLLYADEAIDASRFDACESTARAIVS